MKKLIMALSLCAVVGGPLAATDGGRLAGFRDWWNRPYNSESDGRYFGGSDSLAKGRDSFYRDEKGGLKIKRVAGAVPAGYRYAMDAAVQPALLESSFETSDEANKRANEWLHGENVKDPSKAAEHEKLAAKSRVRVTPRTMISSAALAGLMANGALNAKRGNRTWAMEKLAKKLEGREGKLAQKLEGFLNSKSGRYTGNLLERYVQWALINMLLNRGAYDNSSTVPYTLGVADATMAGANAIRDKFSK